jgi:predicted HD superfamily hydrolase involved in NAD metabolism
MNKFDSLTEIVSKRLDGPRFQHTVSVAQTALLLGKAFSLEPTVCEKLYVAGLLHDITKRLSTNEHIAICEKNGVTLTADDLASPPILHAISGAIVAKQDFAEVVDDTILQAIAYHTTGSANMTLFDKLLYLADYIEPLRHTKACIEAREAFWSDFSNSSDKLMTLNRHLLAITQATRRYIVQNQFPLHPKTNETIRFLQQELGL